MISAYTAAFTSHILGLEKFTAVIGEKLDLSETKVILSLIVLEFCSGWSEDFFRNTAMDEKTDGQCHKKSIHKDRSSGSISCSSFVPFSRRQIQWTGNEPYFSGL